MTTAGWVPPVLSDESIREIEARIVDAFASRSTQNLNVLGFGELGLAIGWPTEQPAMVVKRQAVGSPSEVRSDLDRMVRYHEALEAAGMPVLPSELRRVPLTDGREAGYVIQPLVERDALVEHVLADIEPQAEHRILVSIRDAVLATVRDGPDGGLTVDAQPSNFAWDGERVVILDTTPPLIWDAGGGPFWDSGNYLLAIPAPLRPVAMHLVRKQGDLSRTSRGVLALTAMWMKRIDLPQWVQPAIDTFNPHLDDPITIEEIEREYAEVIKRIPNIKRMARIERFWQTRVRRSDYQFFITNSFTGEIL